MEKWIENLSTSNNASNYFHFIFSFKTALGKAIIKFGNNTIIKSDSWVTCDIRYLREKLTKNYIEYDSNSNIESLTDIINYSLMLLERKLIEDERRAKDLENEIDDYDYLRDNDIEEVKFSKYNSEPYESYYKMKMEINSKYGKLLKQVIGDIEL